jgi:hypothetical protein
MLQEKGIHCSLHRYLPLAGPSLRRRLDVAAVTICNTRNTVILLLTRAMARDAYHSLPQPYPVDRRNAVMPMVVRITTPNSPIPTPASSHLSSIVRRCMLTIYLPPPNWPCPCDATTVPTVDRNPRHDRRVDSSSSSSTIILPGFHRLWPVRMHTHVHTCTTHTCCQSSTDVQRAPTEHLRSHAGPGGVVVRQRTNDTATQEMP